MQRFTSVLAAAAVSIAALASSAPAGAASPYAPPTATIGNDSTIGIQKVDDRRWRRGGPHVSFGFSVPFVPRPYAYAPRAYVYERPYAYDRRYVRDSRCSDGFFYRYPVGCVAAYDRDYRYYDRRPSYYSGGPGVSFHFGF